MTTPTLQAIQKLDETDSASRPRKRDLTIGLLGDIYLKNELFWVPGHAKQIKQALTSSTFELDQCSLVIANLEAPITDNNCLPKEPKPYNFSTTRQCLEVFNDKYVLCLANNHIMDFDSRGLQQTIECLTDAKIPFVGAGMNIDEASKPAFVTTNGFTIAIIGAADPRFHAANSTSAGINPAHPHHLATTIRAASQLSDITIISIHMGLEYTPTISRAQQRLSKICQDAGATIVQFHHSHCISGFQSSPNSCTFYGMGNFIMPNVTGHMNSRSRLAAAWTIRLSPDLRINEKPRCVFGEITFSGIPEPKVVNAKHIKKLDFYNRRLGSNKLMTVWRMTDLLSPYFLIPTLRDIVKMIRTRGYRNTISSLAIGIRRQLF